MSLRCSFRRPTQRGQSAVELALIFPVLLLVLMGIIEFSRAFFTYCTISNAAREGARYGIIHPTWEDSEDHPDPANIKARTERLVAGLEASRLSVSIEFPDGTRNTGDRIRVTVTYRFRMILPIAEFTLRSSSTMRIEQMATE